MTQITDSERPVPYQVANSMKVNPWSRVLLLLLIAGISIAGQGPSGDGNYLRDNSDWWSTLNPQHQDLTAKPERRVIAATNLTIPGLSPMVHDRVDRLKQRLGKARVVIRGGGGATRSQYCSVSSGSDSVYPIAEGLPGTSHANGRYNRQVH
jgi:hypothetical protein